MAAEEKQEKKDVIVCIEGGTVVEITHPADIRVIVRDYDVTDFTDASLDVKTDDDGHGYVEEIWEGIEQ